PIALRQPIPHRVPRTAKCSRDPLRPPSQTLQPLHRRHLVRRLHLVPPQVNPTRRNRRVLSHQTLLLSRGGQFFMSSGGQCAVSPDTRACSPIISGSVG